MLRYWLWLSTLVGLGRKGMLAVLSFFKTPEAAFLADRAEYALVPGLTQSQRDALEQKSLDHAEQILERCARLGISLLTYQDAAYPERLHAIDDAPIVLYYKGRLPELDTRPVIGVVGARAASAYGLLQAKKFGYQLGACGAIVVSGMAKGIDALSMEGALTAGGSVVGVLGCGADRIYPAENRSLFRDVEALGCILTEFEPGTPPDARNFPIRNRIISGLSNGVLVVEAGRRSGALITANRALEQGRDVFAIPSNLDVDVGEGTNQLLRDGAILAMDAWDILKEYAPLYPDKLTRRMGGENLELTSRDLERSAEEKPPEQKSQKQEKPSPEAPTPVDLGALKGSLSPDEWALAQLLTDKPVHVDNLIEQSGLAASQALAALTLLELKQIAVRMPGRRYTLVQK